MVKVWRIAADTPKYTADDLTGGGSKRTGGRWNPPGTAALYCSSSVSLACLETLIHVINDLPSNRYLVRLDIPPTLWKKAEIFPIEDPAYIGWDAEPAGMVSISYGQGWLAEERSAILRVPSVIVPEEDNVVVNPGHSDAGKIKSKKVRKFNYDQRFRTTKSRRVRTSR
jgi:RES domain-containing protein